MNRGLQNDLEVDRLLLAVVDYIYALEGLPPPRGDTLIPEIAANIRNFSKARNVGKGIPSRDDAAYNYYTKKERRG